MSEWTVRPYHREEGTPSPAWPTPTLMANLRNALYGVGDEATVRVRVDVLRSLLAAVDRDGLSRVAGARITDEERGVDYRLTVAGSEGRVWPRTLELVLHDPDQPPDPTVFRLQPQRLADETAIFLAQQAATPPPTPEGAVLIVERPRPATPTTDELAALVQAGMTRRALAARFDRSVVTVDGWLAQARSERPDLFPAQRRGPKPRPTTQTPDEQPARRKPGRPRSRRSDIR